MSYLEDSSYRTGIMKLSTSDITELLELYKEHESLYNTLHSQHADKSVRREELNQLLQELWERGIHIPNVETLKKKIKSLKDTYRTVRVRVETSKKNATEDGEVYKPTMIWYSLADSFLRPFVNSQLVQPENPSESIGIESMMLSKEGADDSDAPSSSKLNGASAGDSVQKSKFVRKLRHRSPSRKRVRLHESDDESSYPARAKTEERIEVREKPDVCETFATYVAMQMRSLPRTRQLMLQTEIQNAITKQFVEWESEGDQIESTVLYMP